jgi:hypothetical protein
MLSVSNCSECDDSGSYLDSDIRELTDLCVPSKTCFVDESP